MTDEKLKPIPKGPGPGNARNDYRIRIPLLVKYRVAVKQEGKYIMSPVFSGVGVDFSGGGAAFKIGKDIPSGFFIYMEIPFPFQPEPLKVVSEVIRTKPDLLKGQKILLCTVKYLLLSPDIRDRMVGFIIGEMALQTKKES
ncbi:MAG: PilZ domain-containing protein [Nitrospinae bacterium]|nr:PilZ domain-containing protein [Nitrospinota bacterium]